MAEWRRRLSDPSLEDALVELGRQVAYPPTRDLAAGVRARLEERGSSGRGAWRRPRRWLLLAAILLVALAAALLLSPGARATLSRWLAVPGVVFITHPAHPIPTPAPAGAALDLGMPVSLDAARHAVPYRVLVPALAGFRAPDEVYLGDVPRQVALVYRARRSLPAAGGTGVGLLLTEFEGSLDPEQAFYFKGLAPGTTLRRVTVDGEQGYWLSGHPHLFFYAPPGQSPQAENIRLATNTLLWQRGGLTLRLESALDLDQALQVAASVR
jgi:hypothetical protein